MPCVLPSNATADRIDYYKALRPCDRVAFDFSDPKGVPIRCSVVMYKPGYKVDGFQGVGVVRWTPFTQYNTNSDAYTFLIPLYIPLILFALIPLVPIVCSVHKVSRDCCDKCGHNLPGNQSGVCPECERPITTPIAPVEKAEYHSAIGLLQRLRDQTQHVSISE